MNRFEEIASDLSALFCLNDESFEHKNAHCMQVCFKELTRCVPLLLYKRIKQHQFDIVFIDQSVLLDAQLIADVHKIKEEYPKTAIFIECEDSNASRILKSIDLNIDKTVLTSMDHEMFCSQIERSITPRFEISLNSRYEKHLEEIIFGKTQELEVQQHCDLLTGFQNTAALKNCFGDKQNKGILYLDIDKFDTINTLYGMKVGDEVLKLVANRLARYLPENSRVFRISADEFAILVYDPKEQQITQLAHQIIAMFVETPIKFNELSFDIFFSIGTQEGSDYDIFYNAKLANREAKYLGGRTCVRYHNDSYFLKMQKENHYWINEIKGALKEDRVIVYYQPIYDNHLGIINKYEALVRLKTVKGDIITPNFFLKPAILSDLITSLSRVVIDKSFKMFSKNDLSFSFNLSDQDFSEGYLEDFLTYKCDYYDVDPSRVYIEILEETSLNCSEDFLEQIHALKKRGFKFSIDDFGIEKSNFSRVLELEAEIIKIDGSFIRGLGSDNSSHIIVDSIVDFAKKIGAETVAEFVEDEDTLHRLQGMGVDYAQGYLIGKPQSTLNNDFL